MTNKTVDPNEEYSTEETADLLGVTSRTVRRYLKDGFLSGRKRGPYPQSGYLVYGWSIIEYLEGMTLDSEETE